MNADQAGKIEALEWLARKAAEGAETSSLSADAKRALARLEKTLFRDAEKLRNRGVKSTPVSERALAFADWFFSLLPQGTKLAPSWRQKWARVYDELTGIDGRSPAQIAAVCSWARKHDFWRAHFFSPAKLRESRGGVCFFDRFSEAMGSRSQRTMHAEPEPPRVRQL